MQRVLLLTSGLLPLFVMAGCGGGPADAPDLAPVSGVVMLDGKPAGGLTVEFHPDNSKDTSGPMSTGVTNDDGSFMLAASGGRSGAVVGAHKVLVKCPWRLDGGRGGEPVTADGFGSSSEGNTEVAAPAETTEECKVDPKFEDSGTSTLTADVPADGVDDLLLQVTSK